jgi:arylformamidase
LEFFDISRTLREGIAVWPGDPDFHSRWVMQIRKGEPCNVSALSMGVHTGTHIDAPLHLDDSGCHIAEIPLRVLVGPVRVLSVPNESCIRAAWLRSIDWRGVERVLFKTNIGTQQSSLETGYTHVDPEAAEFLVQKGILLVGTEAPSVDPFESVDLPSHRILLRNGIILLEEAQLDSIDPGNYELICLPLKLAGLDGSPVRAVLCRK